MSTPQTHGLLSRLLPSPATPVEGAAATYRSRLVTILCLGMVPILLGVAGVTVVVNLETARAAGVAVAAAALMAVALGAAYLLNRAGRTTQAGMLIAGGAAVAVLGVTAAGGNQSGLSIAYLAPTVILAGILLPPRPAAAAVSAVAAEALLLPLVLPSIHYGEVLIPIMVVFSSAALALVVTWQTELLDRDRSAELAVGEARYRLLFDGNPHPMWVYDLETLAFLAVNSAAVGRYGYSAEEFANMTLRDIRPPEDIPGLLENVARVKAGRDEAGLWRHLRKDGSLFWVDVTSHELDYDGRPCELVLAMDVTERRLAEKEREAQHAILQGIIDNTDAAIFSVDREYRYTSFNQAHAAIMKVIYGVEISLGDITLERMTVEADALTAKANIDRALAGERLTEEAPSGDDAYSRRYFQVSHSPVVDESGDVIGAAVIARDVTERHMEEEEARAFSQRLQHAQKLESLGILAGGIAHDFNNILMAVLGHAELARIQVGPLSPAHDNLQEIERAATRASDLAKQMLAYSGKGRFLVQAVDLNELICEMRHMLEVSISKKVSLRHDLAADLPVVKADVTQIQQVLMNLVINAAEAMGDQGGVVRIASGCLECDDEYLGRTWACEELEPGRYAYLEVADSGVGMDIHTVARVFDPFFSTKFTGRGLGLAAVLGIVRGHRGAVKVYSEPMKGTTFKVLLPASDEPAKPLSKEKDAATWTGTGTVLLVDDEQSLCRLGSRMLARLGFKTLTAGDGEEALEIFRTHAEEIACVILDLTMPRMDGEETYRELRRLHADVRVILSSGYNEHDVAQRFMGKGTAGFVQKPYQLADLAEALRGALER
ncbi:MAG: hybrid sensor histidine kinase/response regulator [Thermoleophilia bacterium]